jgi:hypothetical protein
MMNTASDIVTAALGSYGFVFENPGGLFVRYTRTTCAGVCATAWIVPSADGSTFECYTEAGLFSMTEAEILKAFPGRNRGIPGGERSAN